MLASRGAFGLLVWTQTLQRHEDFIMFKRHTHTSSLRLLRGTKGARMYGTRYIIEIPIAIFVDTGIPLAFQHQNTSKLHRRVTYTS